jgi:hypothetical protein
VNPLSRRKVTPFESADSQKPARGGLLRGQFAA